MARQNGQEPVREGRRHGAPLLLPVVPFAEQQPVADDRREDADRRRRPAIILNIVDQDPLDRIGAVEEDERLGSIRVS